jgi:hypothetical protein
MMSEGVTTDKIAALADPFDPSQVHWRAQAMANGKALALAYIDARDVMDRLDAICGPENWQDRYEETPKGRVLCTLSINVNGYWVNKCDGAGDTDVEGDKGAVSDALKRAAVKWGIARYLYSLGNIWVPCEVGQSGKFKKFTDDPWKYCKLPIVKERDAPFTPGPARNKTDLKEKGKELWADILNCADPVELNKILADTIPLQEQLKAELPSWWTGGVKEGSGERFEGLEAVIERLQTDFSGVAANGMDWRGNVLHAG